MLITTTKTNFFRNKREKKTLVVRKKFKTEKKISKVFN